jgi:hypothetical protein
VNRSATLAWRRSSRCESGSCVEVALAGDGVAIRDSKHPGGANLLFTRGEWEAFVEGVRAGDFEFHL